MIKVITEGSNLLILNDSEDSERSSQSDSSHWKSGCYCNGLIMIFWVSKREPFSYMCFLLCLLLNLILSYNVIQKWKHPYHNSYQSFFSSPPFPLSAWQNFPDLFDF